MSTTSTTTCRLDDIQFKVVDPAVAVILRGMSVTQKVELILELNRVVRHRITQQTRVEHPDWTDAQITSDVADRMLHGEVGELWASDILAKV
ncbi:MAG: hypothetical protein HZA46_18885 [Planctomycetales bacterium]|nr:hypothetical protein [Planctomycetales bacterium]